MNYLVVDAIANLILTLADQNYCTHIMLVLLFYVLLNISIFDPIDHVVTSIIRHGILLLKIGKCIQWRENQQHTICFAPWWYPLLGVWKVHISVDIFHLDD